MWQSLHHFESSSTEEWTRNHHTREGENSEQGEFGGESEPAVEATPEGESLSEQGEGRFNVFEPEGEPSGHGRGVRNPQTYPDLTEEVSGVQYPGNGIDLSPFSEYERMGRLCKCYEMRIEAAVVNNDYETYERLSRELARVEGLQLAASDIRPGEATS